MSGGDTIPAAQMKHVTVDKMLEDSVLHKQRIGIGRNVYRLDREVDLNAYLHNNFGIPDLEAYIAGFSDEMPTRSKLVNISSDSKLRRQRTFKGFLVNSYEPVAARLNGAAQIIHPPQGMFHFIADYETFIPAEDVVVVGIENPENFRYIATQAHLFKDYKPLFLSRYPQSQSGDVIRWLQMIRNGYLHFGDFDFAGIRIISMSIRNTFIAGPVFLFRRMLRNILSTTAAAICTTGSCTSSPTPVSLKRRISYGC